MDPLSYPRIDAHRDRAPSVVVAGLDDIDLVATLRPVLRFPQLPFRIPGEPLRIAVTVAPDGRQRTGLADERVILRHRAVVVDAVDFTKRARQILRERRVVLLAERVEQMAVLVEREP